MNLFSEESIFGKIFGFLGNLILLNLLWILCSLPLITLGASTSALYYAVLKLHRGSDSSPLKDFFESLQDNFKQATGIWLLLATCGGFIVFETQWLWSTNTPFSRLLFYALIGLMLIGFILLLYIFPVIAAFRNNLKSLIGHAFYFAFHKIGYLVIVALVTLLPMYFSLVDAVLLPINLFLWLTLGFSLTAYVNAWFYLRLFKPHFTLPDIPSPDNEAPDQTVTTTLFKRRKNHVHSI